MNSSIRKRGFDSVGAVCQRLVSYFEDTSQIANTNGHRVVHPLRNHNEW